MMYLKKKLLAILLWPQYVKLMKTMWTDTFLFQHYDNVLTHWGLVMPFGDLDLGQHWFR